MADDKQVTVRFTTTLPTQFRVPDTELVRFLFQAAVEPARLPERVCRLNVPLCRQNRVILLLAVLVARAGRLQVRDAG